MSLIIVTYVPGGIVMAADSRATATLRNSTVEQGQEVLVESRFIVTDASEKLFLLPGNTGLATFGDMYIGNYEIGHYIQAFVREHHPDVPLAPATIAEKLQTFFRSFSSSPDLTLLLAGYHRQNPEVWSVPIKEGSPIQHNRDQNGLSFGLIRGGETGTIDRLLSHSPANPKFETMPLQTAVDFTRHLMDTSIAHAAFEPRFNSIGGPVDLLIITRETGRFVAKKELY